MCIRDSFICFLYKKITFLLFKIIILICPITSLVFVQASITGVYTDFNGFTASSATSLNPTRVDSQNNLLGFTSEGITYSTGVNDATLTANGVSFTAGNYRALVPSVAISGAAGQGSLDDGNATNFTGQIYPTPARDTRAYLVDGINGLGFSTFANNVGETFIFDLSSIDFTTVGDGIPDFMYFNPNYAIGF